MDGPFNIIIGRLYIFQIMEWWKGWIWLALVVVGGMALKDPILNLQLSVSENDKMITTFAIGSSEVNVYIDIGYQGLDICCKNANSIFRQVYYFIIDPFRQDQDYTCKDSENNSRENDTAVFTQIGPINIEFNEIMYPKCSVGRLGFNKKSEFLSLMPVSEQFFIIYPETNTQKKIIRWKLDVGGTIKNSYNYFTTVNSDDWNIQTTNIKFDEISFQQQTIKFITKESYLGIPNPYFSYIKTKLIDNYNCQYKHQIIYCPCTAGISSSFPNFQVFFNESLSYGIKEDKYLHEEDEICRAVIREIESPVWEINIMLMENIDILFDYRDKRMGIANHIDSVSVNELINEPLQLILNCAVVLLMCFFLAMILIEIVKNLINIDGASYESFQTYMLKHSQ